MGSTSDAPGWFGKLSSLGDFAQRRVSTQWVSTCDGWLSASMQAGQDHMRERWIDAYLHAPVLRFGWAPGVIDEQWWFGVLMPSCDNVGRYFPLLIAQSRAQAPEDRIALDHLELWLDHLADAAIHTLSDAGVSIDDFEGLLHDAPPWPSAGRGLPLVAQGPPEAEHWSGGVAHLPLFRWLHPLAAAQLTQRLNGHSLWWRVDQAGSQDAIDIVRGLPDGSQFVALIEGSHLSAREIAQGRDWGRG